ncbi:universal stress protein [Halococcus salsus]|uniref:universal stress protein n=1 Tax=Halococcus salsus TaxID=2162894 RepID=UPI00135764C5|nr:universal stress protein [Halococcus salsus]
MSTQVLVPLTDSSHAWPGLKYALELYPEADITVINVIDPAGAGYGEYSSSEESGQVTPESQAEALFTAASDLASESGRDLTTTLIEGRPAEAIVEHAENHSFDAIVMGSRGRSGVSRVLLGSVAGSVVENSSVPVTVVP